MMLRKTINRALLVVVGLLAGDCARPSAVTIDSAVESRTSVVAPEYSVYDLGSNWRDQTGATVPLASLRGRPRVLAMIYTHCEAVCPLTVADMKQIEERTPSDVGLVLVSLDPGRDSVSQLAAFASARGLGVDRWTLLTGSEADIQDLAAAVGIRYRRLSATELAHANTLIVLDAVGAVVRQQAGLEGTAETIRLARTLVR